METSLHRDLKILYAGRQAQYEVSLLGYRIDAIARGRLVEIQHGSLGAIRDKIRHLLQSHRVTIVKPIVAAKTLVKKTAPGGEVLSRRLSPKRGQLLDLFDEMVHFTNVFPHRGLTLEVLLVEVEESAIRAMAVAAAGGKTTSRSKISGWWRSGANTACAPPPTWPAWFVVRCRRLFTPATWHNRWACGAGQPSGSSIASNGWARCGRSAKKATPDSIGRQYQ